MSGGTQAGHHCECVGGYEGTLLTQRGFKLHVALIKEPGKEEEGGGGRRRKEEEEGDNNHKIPT